MIILISQIKVIISRLQMSFIKEINHIKYYIIQIIILLINHYIIKSLLQYKPFKQCHKNNILQDLTNH